MIPIIHTWYFTK